MKLIIRIIFTFLGLLRWYIELLKPTEEEKEKIYAARGVSKLNIAISKNIKDPLNYCYCKDDLEKGGEYGKAVIQEYKGKTQKQQNRQKAPQGKR